MTDKPKPPPLRMQLRSAWGEVAAERRVAVAVLERFNRMRDAGRLRGRPWWRGLSRNWKAPR